MTDIVSVLHIDDSIFDIELIRDILEKEQTGFTIRSVRSQRSFVEALVDGQYDVVLSDFNILGFDALGVIKYVQEIKPDLPVIVVTGTGSEEIAVAAMKQGAADYVIKHPSHIQKLPQTIHAVLEKKKLRWERKKATEDLHSSLDSLRRAMTGIIDVVVHAVEIRDPYTAGHQRRVANLARTIAGELRLPPETIEGIRVAGIIHDLGKISVPAEILSMPRKLSDIEYRLVKEHVEIGYDILKNIEFPWPVADIVRQHHERLDGSGYPQGLQGGEILMEARILAVADTVEAIASHRPYRPAYGLDAALNEIVVNRGVLYDPDVVNACVTICRDKDFQMI